MKNDEQPSQLIILNISVNLARLSEWVMDSYQSKEELISKFLQQTEQYLFQLKGQKIKDNFQPTLDRFTNDFIKLKRQKINSKTKLAWAEKALTWANILQHRAKLA